MKRSRTGAGPEAAGRLHREALVVDSHVDTAGRCRDEGFDFMKRNASGHVDYPRLKEGGLDALVMAVYFGKPEKGRGGRLVTETVERIGWIRSLADRHPDRIALALSASDVRRAAASGKTALMIGIEGGHLIDGRIEVLRRYHELGARLLTLTHIFHHDWADSAGFGEPLPPRHGGLAPFGRRVVAEMNRLGMVVDVSHAADSTFFDVLAASTAPAMATHSACRALCRHSRNMSDEMIRALAAGGGVIQIPYYPDFIGRAPRGGDSSIEGVLDHIVHVADLVGAEHVGLGSDWDGIPRTVAGLEDCSRLPAVTEGLLARGLGPAEVKGVLGENFLRVFAAVTGS